MKLHPEAVRKAKQWAEAVRIIDATEIELRDVVERALAPLADLRPDKIATAAYAANVTARLMRRITRLRTAAFKDAFRHVRDRHGIRSK